MQYDTIILELLSRIKVLESEVDSLKHTVSMLEQCSEATDSAAPAPEAPVAERARSTSYVRLTDHMADTCYAYGKRASLSPDINLSELAASAAALATVSPTRGSNAFGRM